MPKQRCIKKGKRGVKWGKEGTCYTCPRAEEKMNKQREAIEASKAKRDKYYNDLLYKGY